MIVLLFDFDDLALWLGRFQPFRNKAQCRILLLPKYHWIFLHAIDHRAHLPDERRHRNGLFDFGLGCTIEFGCGRMGVDAVNTRDLGSVKTPLITYSLLSPGVCFWSVTNNETLPTLLVG
jgi:hypothetical protein